MSLVHSQQAQARGQAGAQQVQTSQMVICSLPFVLVVLTFVVLKMFF